MKRLCIFFIGCIILSCTAATPAQKPTAQQWEDFIQRVHRVVAVEDGVLRNFQITQSYYDLGVMLQDLLGTSMKEGSSPQANWPTVATWASNSVGMSIRGQTLPDWLWITLRNDLPKWLIELLDFFPEVIDIIFSSILSKTSGYLAGGNQLVFDQVAGSLARFGYYFGNLTTPDTNRWNQFEATFNKSEWWQRTILNASEAYYNAIWTSGKVQAEWILLANMYVGLGEQTILQPFIYGAMQHNASISFSFPGLGKITINEAALVTEMLITLLFSNEILYAGKDVTPRPWDGRDWPVDLVTIDNPATRKLYLQLVGQTENFAGTAATNWVELSQRMRYVVPMFRSRQDDVYLVRCPPFSKQQVEEMWKGIKPNSNNLCMATCCRSSPIVANW